jgi:hypothetical protein
LPPVLVEISVEAVEGVISLPGPALQVLASTGKGMEDGVREGTNTEESERRNHEAQRKTTNLEDAPRGTTVNPQRLVQRPVERSAVVTELLPQLLLGLGLDEVGWRRAGMLPLLLRMRGGATRSWKGGVRRRGPGTISRAPSAAPPLPLTTSTPVEGSGAGAGRLTHWSQPGGRTSSSGISTIAARLSSIGDGAGGTDGAVTAMVMNADGAATAHCTSAVVAACCVSAAVADCCGSAVVAACRGPASAAAPREPSLAAVAVFPAARDALDERRLVGTAASDLSTLAGARGSTVGATL